LLGRDPGEVREITTAQYAEGRLVAARPASSLLSMRRIEATGFEPSDARAALRRYVTSLP
jgi:dTDP-4-dehydrorhamnose 3,5-epimerase/reductase